MYTMDGSEEAIELEDTADSETEEITINMDALASLLNVRVEVIQSLMSLEEHKHVVQRFVEEINIKQQQLEEYESTLREFSDSVDINNVQIEEKDRQIEELSSKLEQESTLRDQLQATISSYAQAELDRKEQPAKDVLLELKDDKEDLEATKKALKTAKEMLEDSQQAVETAHEELGETKQSLDTTQDELQETLQVLETTQTELQEARQEIRELEESLRSKQRDLDEADEQTEQLRKELESNNQRLSVVESELTTSKETVAELSVPPPEVPGADRQELLRMLDRRQHEIARLAEEWKNLSSQLEITSAKKTEFQTRLDELVIQEASLRLKEQLLQQEKSLLKSQNEWLSSELQSKSEQVLSLRKEKASCQSELENKLSQKQEEVKHLNSLLEDQRKIYASLESQTEESLSKSRLQKEEMATLEEHLRRELSNQAKLTELYKSASSDAEDRVSELLSGVEKLRSLLETVSQEKEQLQAQLDTELARNETVERDLSTSLASQKQELARANDLLTSLRHRGRSLSEVEVLSLSPAAARASAMLKSGKTLTQIYSEHIEVCEQLEQSKQENLTLNNHIEQIVQELSEKTPALQKLRRDYDSSVQSCSSLTAKVNALVDECETLRLEGEDAVKQYRGAQRETQRLKALTADLGRQVKILLKECEEARGGVASSSMISHDTHMDISSGDISSSSQTISRHLVEFRNIEELQEQNQRLLTVVRELSDQNEEQERAGLNEQTQELRDQLDKALSEISDLRNSRERQNEVVKSVIQQRDMYRTLLAQATPLPTDSIQDDTQRDGGRGQADLSGELKELKEQFEAYRKEKVTNDKMLMVQMEETREQCSELRLENAKLVSKLEHANDRYKLLDNQTVSLKKELEVLRAKNLQLSNALSTHQATISNTTQELLASREKLTKAEVALNTVRAERELLEASEKRARTHYEELLREQKGHQVLLTNLQSIQNNLEKTEFETRARLGARIEALERELALTKERLHSEEDRRSKSSEAYEIQVRDLEGKLGSLKETKASVDEKLHQSKEEGAGLRAELEATKGRLEEEQSQLQEATDKILRLEADAGSEFRGRIRVLERQLADTKVKVRSLEGQLESSRKHAEEYKNMSESYETQLTELNNTTEEFKTRMEASQTASQQRERELSEKVELLETAKKDLEHTLQESSNERQNQLSDLEVQISTLTSKTSALQLELTAAREEATEARDDAAKYAESASETLSNYQRELAQHGKTMEELLTVKDQLTAAQGQVSSVRGECEQLKVELAASQDSWGGRERQLLEQLGVMETRVQDLGQQNTVLHQEAEKLSARMLTLQEQQGLDTSLGALDTSGSNLKDKSTEQLWEIIRFVRREREIATTRQELAESENTRHKQQVEHLQKQLTSARGQLVELTEAAQLHTESAAQHAEILAKVESLNVLNDSNKLLRGERDRQVAAIAELEERCEELQKETSSLKKENKSLTAQKDALVAEKTALRNEVQRWNTRTNQLIEQYNKIDPEEYKKLLEERESLTSQLSSLQADLESLQSQLTASQSERDSLESQCSSLKDQVDQTTKDKEGLADEVKQLQTDVASKLNDIQAKTVLVGKLKDIGRKYRQLHETVKKELEECKAENEELKKKLEEAQSAPAETTLAPPTAPTSEDNDKNKELEETQSTIDGLKNSLHEMEDKYNKLLKTVKVARSRIQSLATEKDKAIKEAESANNEKDKLKTDLETCQQELDSLKEKHESETVKLNATIAKLQQTLKERAPRRKVVPPSISEGAPTLQSSAPTAAVKPTVTTTPTASIRPMAIQTTTTAPTAHVTPTMIAPVNSTQLLTSGSSTPTATVFMRTSSSTQVPAHIPSTSAVSSSVTPSTSSLGIARASPHIGRGSGDEGRGGVTKRQREEEEGGASTTVEPPASKRKKPLIVQRVKQRQVEAAASSTLSPDTQGEVGGAEGEGPQASESQVLAAESQSVDQSQVREETPSGQVVPETDMDTQQSVVGSEGAEVTDPLSLPPSREGSELPQVSQSQEQSVESTDKEPAVSKTAPLSSEAEMVSRDSGIPPTEGTPSGEVSGADSVVRASVDSSEMTAVEGGQGEGGMADTTHRSEEEESGCTGSGSGLSEPTSEREEVTPTDQSGDVVEASDSVEGVMDVGEPCEGVEGNAGEGVDNVREVEAESGDSVDNVISEQVEKKAAETETSEDVEREPREGVESEGVQSEPCEDMEGETREGVEDDDEEIDEEVSESLGEEEEYEEEEDDDVAGGTVASPIVIESSSGEDEEQDNDFEIRMESSSEEEVDPSERTESEVSQDPSQDQSHDQYEPAGGPSDQTYEYMPSEAGLPDDEPSIVLPTVQHPRPTSMPVRRLLNQGLQFSEHSSSALTPGFEPQIEDSVVPHTPVLNEGKQLGGRAQALPHHTSSERTTYTVPQTTGSSLSQSLAATDVDPTVIQSLGEAHIDMSSTPPLAGVSHDPGSHISVVSSEGDIPDIDIDRIVEEDTSSSEGDLEEGQLDVMEEEEEEIEDQPEAPSTVSTTTSVSESQSTSSVASTSSGPLTAVSSIGGQVSSVPLEECPPPTKKKPQPIVWSQPSSSSGTEPRGRRIIRPRRGAPRFKAKPQK